MTGLIDGSKAGGSSDGVNNVVFVVNIDSERERERDNRIAADIYIARWSGMVG